MKPHLNAILFIVIWRKIIMNNTRNAERKAKKLTFLKLVIEGHPLFENQVSFSVVNDSRVSWERAGQLTNLFGSVWVNNLITIIGKNATGKTTIMKTLIGTLTFLLYSKSINQTQLDDILIGTSPIKLTTYFWGNDMKVYKDALTLKLNAVDHSWHVSEEKIYEKQVITRTPKKELLNFEGIDPCLDRENLNNELAAYVLAPDDSIFRTILAKKNYQVQQIMDTLIFTNVNALFYTNGNVPAEILNFLDPTIEYLRVDNKQVEGDKKQMFYRLKFKNHPEEFTETNFATIEHYLSSGTAKGVTLYGNVLRALQTGGIIFIDELENHFNHAIVRSFIEYFADPRINTNRATLIFSTHYSELLDDLERGDEIYLTKREHKIQLQRYSKSGVRKDLSKSDVFDSNYLGGTAPKYQAYIKLRNATKGVVNNDN